MEDSIKTDCVVKALSERLEPFDRFESRTGPDMRYATHVMSSICPFLILLALSPHVVAQTPAVDGIFNEWKPASQIATDPEGDNKSGFDLSTVSAMTDGNVLYLHFDIGQEINLQNGNESDGTLKLQLVVKEKTLEVDFRKRTVTDGTSEHIGWQTIGLLNRLFGFQASSRAAITRLRLSELMPTKSGVDQCADPK